MITSRHTTKAQMTLPRAVRAPQGLQPGDAIAYVVENGRVTLSKAESIRRAVDDPFLNFTEWASAEDDEAYADL